MKKSLSVLLCSTFLLAACNDKAPDTAQKAAPASAVAQGKVSQVVRI